MSVHSGGSSHGEALVADKLLKYGVVVDDQPRSVYFVAQETGEISRSGEISRPGTANGENKEQSRSVSGDSARANPWPRPPAPPSVNSLFDFGSATSQLSGRAPSDSDANGGRQGVFEGKGRDGVWEGKSNDVFGKGNRGMTELAELEPLAGFGVEVSVVHEIEEGDEQLSPASPVLAGAGSLLSDSILLFNDAPIVAGAENVHGVVQMMMGEEEADVVEDEDEAGPEPAVFAERNILRVLRFVPWFKEMGMNELRDVARAGLAIFYPEGNTMIEQGEDGDSMFIVLEGTVHLEIELGQGATVRAQKHQAQLLQEGQTFGESAVVWVEPEGRNHYDDEYSADDVGDEDKWWKGVAVSDGFDYTVREWTAVAETQCTVLELSRRRLMALLSDQNNLTRSLRVSYEQSRASTVIQRAYRCYTSGKDAAKKMTDMLARAAADMAQELKSLSPHAQAYMAMMGTMAHSVVQENRLIQTPPPLRRPQDYVSRSEQALQQQQRHGGRVKGRSSKPHSHAPSETSSSRAPPEAGDCAGGVEFEAGWRQFERLDPASPVLEAHEHQLVYSPPLRTHSASIIGNAVMYEGQVQVSDAAEGDQTEPGVDDETEPHFDDPDAQPHFDDPHAQPPDSLTATLTASHAGERGALGVCRRMLNGLKQSFITLRGSPPGKALEPQLPPHMHLSDTEMGGVGQKEAGGEGVGGEGGMAKGKSILRPLTKATTATSATAPVLDWKERDWTILIVTVIQCQELPRRSYRGALGAPVDSTLEVSVENVRYTMPAPVSRTCAPYFGETFAFQLPEPQDRVPEAEVVKVEIVDAGYRRKQGGVNKKRRRGDSLGIVLVPIAGRGDEAWHYLQNIKGEVMVGRVLIRTHRVILEGLKASWYECGARQRFRLNLMAIKAEMRRVRVAQLVAKMVELEANRPKAAKASKMMHPEGLRRMELDALAFVASLLVVVLAPIAVCFDVQASWAEWLMIVSTGCDGLLAFDAYSRFYSGYLFLDGHGHWKAEDRISKCRAHYFDAWRLAEGLDACLAYLHAHGLLCMAPNRKAPRFGEQLPAPPKTAGGGRGGGVTRPDPGWFWLDVLTCFPAEIFLAMVRLPTDPYYRTIAVGRIGAPRSFLRVVQVMKVMRVARVDDFLNSLQRSRSTRLAGTMLIKVLLYAALWMHWVACLWFAAVRAASSWQASSLPPGYSNRNSTNSSYTHKAPVLHADQTVQGLGAAASTVNISAHTPQWWTCDDREKLLGAESSGGGRYVCALHWATQTMLGVGIGDVPLLSLPERMLAVIGMPLGLAVSMSIVASLAALLPGAPSLQTACAARVRRVMSFLKVRQLPKDVRRDVERFYESQWHASGGNSDFEMLRPLPLSLQSRALMALHGHVLEAVPFFRPRLKDLRFWRIVLKGLEQVSYMEGEWLFREGEPAHHLFLLKHGQCSVLSERFEGHGLDDDGRPRNKAPVLPLDDCHNQPEWELLDWEEEQARSTTMQPLPSANSMNNLSISVFDSGGNKQDVRQQHDMRQQQDVMQQHDMMQREDTKPLAVALRPFGRAVSQVGTAHAFLRAPDGTAALDLSVRVVQEEDGVANHSKGLGQKGDMFLHQKGDMSLHHQDIAPFDDALGPDPRLQVCVVCGVWCVVCVRRVWSVGHGCAD